MSAPCAPAVSLPGPVDAVAGLGSTGFPPPPPFQACASSHSLCSNLSSTWSLSEFPSPLVGPEAAGEVAFSGGSEPHTSVRCPPTQTWGGTENVLELPTQSGVQAPAAHFTGRTQAPGGQEASLSSPRATCGGRGRGARRAAPVPGARLWSGPGRVH